MLPSGEDVKQLRVLSFEDFICVHVQCSMSRGSKQPVCIWRIFHVLEDFPTRKYLAAHCLLHGTSLESVREQLWLWDVTVRLWHSCPVPWPQPTWYSLDTIPLLHFQFQNQDSLVPAPFWAIPQPLPFPDPYVGLFGSALAWFNSLLQAQLLGLVLVPVI